MAELRVGIVGAGLIGGKRAAALKGGKLVAVADLSVERAKKLADAHGAEVSANWETLVARKDIDAVIVATSNNAIPPCAVAALRAGKHVLVEKPAGRHPEDVRAQVLAAQESGRTLCVGFNHRFHPAFQKAKRLIESGQFGPLMYIRARYGHGGRIGYDKEWRADPAVAGGGELLDQGVHLIDLCRFTGGEFDLSWGDSGTYFWNMPVEDNGFMYLKSPDRKRSAFLHASCTEWKNLFDFEIFLRDAKIEIWGLGRSYGTEELRVYKMKPEMGPPDIETEAFPGEDHSWQLEFDAFLAEIAGRRTDIGKIEDALKAVEIVHGVYRLSGASWARS
ncbi:MAG: Gfo/Idh/MocA family oxidoreductase [Oligoflexia bacterium]|nr:Gfo/Idh/MocA family oxidoreductase [Oligoflexia bacterium]